jgi:GNAT superfamily N-acetyltransferase
VHPDAVALPNLPLPEGHRLVSLATRPDLAHPMSDFNGAVWPEFMLNDPVMNEHWHHTEDDWPDSQLLLLDGHDAIAATANTSPLGWDGTDRGLPAGIDGQLLAAVEGLRSRTPPDTMGALQIIVDPARRGTGLADLMLRAMCGSALGHGHRAVIACVRPTWKERYPLAPIERYARWARDDGQPFDPWIRLHLRAGGRMVRPEPASMRITGTVADWEGWTGMAFPDSGDHIVPGAAAVVHIDREADLGTYLDPNVWIVHDLTGPGGPVAHDPSGG